MSQLHDELLQVQDEIHAYETLHADTLAVIRKEMAMFCLRQRRRKAGEISAQQLKEAEARCNERLITQLEKYL
jgi:hypothetical protein